MSPRGHSPVPSDSTETPKPEFIDDEELKIDEDQSDLSNDSDNDEGIKISRLLIM